MDLSRRRQQAVVSGAIKIFLEYKVHESGHFGTRLRPVLRHYFRCHCGSQETVDSPSGVTVEAERGSRPGEVRWHVKTPPKVKSATEQVPGHLRTVVAFSAKEFPLEACASALQEELQRPPLAAVVEATEVEMILMEAVRLEQAYVAQVRERGGVSRKMSNEYRRELDAWIASVVTNG